MERSVSTRTGADDRAGAPAIPGKATAPAPAGGRVLDRLLRPGPVGAVEIVGLVLLCLAVVVAIGWVQRVPLLLGHDESVYAVMARHWQDASAPYTGVALHRAPLLPALGVPVLALGGGELGLRLIGLVALVGSGVAVWWLGRMLAGPVAGLLAAAVFMLAPTVFRAGTYFLTDLPAAGLLVALTGLLWRQFAVREAPDRWLLLAAPIAWAAYELRYGSALVVVILFLATGWFFWPTVRRSARLVGGTIVLLVALLVPHLVNATLEFGTPWGRLVYTSSIAGRDFLGQGLLQYAVWFPRLLAGVLAAALMLTGIVGTVTVAVRTRAWSRSRAWFAADGQRMRALAFLAVVAGTHVVAIGVASHGEPRFVFFAVALTCVLGAVVVRDLLTRLSVRSAMAVWVVLGVVGVVLAGQTARLARGEGRYRDGAMRDDRLMVTASEAVAERAGDDCSVLTTYTPQVTWYSGCASYHFGQPPVDDRERYLTDDGWMLLFDPGKRQPEGDLLDGYLSISEPVESWNAPVDGDFAGAELYRIVPEAG